MSNFIIAIAVFLITVIGALFAVPYFIDWNGYRSVFEEEATRLLGREVRVGGAVNLHLLPTPYFRFEKVRIADASVNLQEPFFRADSVTIKLSVPPFFRGAVEANEIEFQRPVLRLALDDKDGWNWQSFGQALGNAAYLPTNVALSSVTISDGVLAVHAPDGTERTRLEGVQGELSAPALDGPYRFRGTFGKARAERELRIATARPEADGAVRFKAVLRVSEAAATYTLDGRLLDLMGRPRIDGELTARLPLGGLWQSHSDAAVPGKAAAAGAETRTDRGEAAFDLKANVRLDPAGAALSDLALSFEQDGRPQLITGDLTARWREIFSVDVNLSSRWLDLDRIVAVGEGAGPLDSIIPLAVRMRDLLPAEGRSRASIAVDQANIGREAISGLRLSLVRTPDKLEVEQLRLGMPGGSRGELQGVVSGPPEAPVFDGSLGVRGASVFRFLGWAAGSPVPVEAKGDGTFGIRALISIGPGRAAARDIVGDLAGTAVYGTARYSWNGRPELSVLLEGPQLDARAFIPAGSSLGDLLEVVLHGPFAGPAPERSPGAAKPGWRSAQTDAVIRVNAGQVITAARTYRDVAMEVELKGGRLRLPLLRVAGDDGFSLELEGEVQDAASRPKGSVRAIASAETAQGIAPLAELLGIPEAYRPSERRAQAMVPLRIAGSASFGTRTATSADLVLDGEANGANVQLSGRFDGAPAGWRTAAADITAVMESADAGVIAALLAPDRSQTRTETTAPGRLLVKASGVPSEGLAAIASIEAGDVGLDFRGRITMADAGNTAAGELEIKAADGTRMAALAGLAPPLRLDGPVAGTLRLAASAASISLERLALKVGGSDMKGRIALSTAGDRRRVEAHLDVEEISVARLLTPLLDQRLAAVTGAAESAIGGRQALWPDQPFDASALDAFEGSIRLDAKRLTLADGIGIGQASLDIALEGGKVEVRQLEGTALGGRLGATLRIEKVPAGAEISGSVRLTGGELAALEGNVGWKPRASGSIAGEIKFSGRGTSPRNLISVLRGSGTLEFADTKLATLWPGAVGVATEAALKADPDKAGAVLRQELAAALSSGQMALPATIAVEIADGQLAAKPFVIDTDEGRASATASLDLKTLILDSEWRLEQKPGAGSRANKTPLPAVTVGYRGPAASLAGLEPRIGADALERELAVRRMERDVEELERLRKLDEARRRGEAERLRRQLEQTPPPAPVPVAPAPGGARPAAPG